MPQGRKERWKRRFAGLYRERIGASMHAAEGTAATCSHTWRALPNAGMTFALCMEYGRPGAKSSLPDGPQPGVCDYPQLQGSTSPYMRGRRPQSSSGRWRGATGRACCVRPTGPPQPCRIPELAGRRRMANSATIAASARSATIRGPSSSPSGPRTRALGTWQKPRPAVYPPHRAARRSARMPPPPAKPGMQGWSGQPRPAAPTRGCTRCRGGRSGRRAPP